MATKLNLKVKGKNDKKHESFITKAKFVLYLKNGLDIKKAAKLANINDYQLSIMRSDPEFEDLVDFCISNCEHRHLKNINMAGDLGQWQASAWVLEKMFPEKYGRKDTIKHEYEIKLLSFQKVILSVINKLEPSIKHKVMQELRSINVDEFNSNLKSKNNQSLIEDESFFGDK